MNLSAKRRMLEHDADANTWREEVAIGLDRQLDALGAVLAHLQIAEAIAMHRHDQKELVETRSYIGLVRAWTTTIADQAAALRAAGDDRRQPAPIDFARRPAVDLEAQS